MAALPRETFDCAYSKLETTIRNFSREKFALESNIAQQNLTISSLKSDIENLNSDIQKLQLEKQQRETAGKRDEEYRCSVEAALFESEKKIEAYYMSLNQFESTAQCINNYIASFENIIQTCKYRQIELLDHISATEELRLNENKTFQEKTIIFERQMATQEEFANSKCKEYYEEVKNLNLEINGLQTHLENQKKLFEHAAKDHDIFVKDLQANHADQILQNNITLSDVKKKYGEIEFELNATLQSKNILLEERATKVMNLEEEVGKLKLLLDDQINKFEVASINHKKVVDDICSDRVKLLQEKDDIMAAQQKKASEVEDQLNDTLNKIITQLEDKDAQVKKLELEIHELDSSVQNCRTEFQEKNSEHNTAILKFQNLCNDYQNQIDEKNSLFCALESKLSEVEKQMNLSLREANKQCDKFVQEIKNLESAVSEKTVSIENVQKILAEKEELILLQGQKITDTEKKAEEIEKQLQLTLNNCKNQIEERNAKVISLESEIKELQVLLKSEKEKLEETNKVHNEFVTESSNEFQMRLKKKEDEVAALEQKMIENEATWISFRNDINVQLELNGAKINDLELERAALQTSLRDSEKDLEEKCSSYNKSIDDLTQSNENQMKEKDALLSELELKLRQIEKEMNSSLNAATENYEKSCTKLKDLEEEINVKKESIVKLNRITGEKDIAIMAILGDTERLKRDMEEHRERAMENYKSFREVSAAKQSLEEAYVEKLNKMRMELYSTREELSKLKVLYVSRERSINKFMNEPNNRKVKVPVSYQYNNQMQSKTKPTTLVPTTRSELQTNARENENKGNHVGDINKSTVSTVSPIRRPSSEETLSFPLEQTFESSKHSNLAMQTKTLNEIRMMNINKLKQAIGETYDVDENSRKSQSPRPSVSNKTKEGFKGPAAAKMKVYSRSKPVKKGILKNNNMENTNYLEKRNVQFESPIAFFKSPSPLQINEKELSSQQSADGSHSTEDGDQVLTQTPYKRSGSTPDWLLDSAGRSKKERLNNQ